LLDRIPQLLYIMSLSHSGSTLLDVLVSGHTRAMSVGEAKRFSPLNSSRMSCSCEVDLVWECPFWREVDAVLRRSELSLKTIDLCGGDDPTFALHNREFYRAVRQVTARDCIVDSSKSFDRFRRLEESGEFEITPIHLVRSPHGVVYSHLKKGRDWVQTARNYTRQYRQIRAFLEGHAHEFVRYERLAEDPARVLRDLMPRLGLSFELEQLDWAARERHNCGGNRMRRSRSSSIRVDHEWKTGLRAWQKAAVSVLTYSTRH
jgi:hypothetical protein